MCPRGARDDSDTILEAPSYRLDDMAELAVRLGSPYDYQRSGEVLLATDFADGWGGWLVIVGTPYGYVRLTSAYTKAGGVAVVVYTGLGSINYGGIFYLTHYPLLTALGLKVSLAWDEHIDYIDLSFYIADGVQGANFRISYYPATYTLKYLTTDNTWVTISTSLKLTTTAYLFHDFKLLIDYAKQRYLRFMVDQYEFNMLNFIPDIADNSISARANCYIRAYSDGITQGLMYIDNVVITQHDFGPVTL